MISRRFEGGLCIRPGCSARPATARLRRAYWGAHSRAAVDPSDTALHPFAVGCRGSSRQMSTDSYSQEPHTKSDRIFPLELRAKTKTLEKSK